MSINWKEVCKFLSGAFFVSAGVNAYFYVTHLAVPFLWFTISPELLGLRSIIHFVLFLICIYIGFIRTKSGSLDDSDCRLGNDAADMARPCRLLALCVSWRGYRHKSDVRGRWGNRPTQLVDS